MDLLHILCDVEAIQEAHSSKAPATDNNDAIGAEQGSEEGRLNLIQRKIGEEEDSIEDQLPLKKQCDSKRHFFAFIRTLSAFQMVQRMGLVSWCYVFSRCRKLNVYKP